MTRRKEPLPRIFPKINGLRDGAVILLDALGFRGIWRRHKPKLVLDTLRALRIKGRSLRGRDRTGVLLSDDRLEHSVLTISDTIIIVVILRRHDYAERYLYRAAKAGLDIAGHLIHGAIFSETPMTFRGSLSIGPVLVEGGSIIGPAIDEAAEYASMADGPFLAATPSALQIIDRYAETFHDRIEPTSMLRYDLPTKVECHVPTLVHCFSGISMSSERFDETRRRLLSTFGPLPRDPAVERKRENLMKFLRHIAKVRRKEAAKKYGELARLPEWDEMDGYDRTRMIMLLMKLGISPRDDQILEERGTTWEEAIKGTPASWLWLESMNLTVEERSKE